MKRLKVDWSRANEVLESGEFEIPWKLFTAEEISEMLFEAWSPEIVEDALDDLQLVDTLPLRCRGEECDFASVCPLVHNDSVGRFISKGCPIEMLDIYRNLVGYLNELHVLWPEDHVDLVTIVDLCRVLVLTARCDKILSLESPIDVVQSGKNVQTKVESNQRAESPAHIIIDKLRAARIKLEAQLSASRADKEKNKNRRRGVSMKDLVSALQEQAKQSGLLPEITENRFEQLEIDNAP